MKWNQKLHVSEPGWPEKTSPEKGKNGKKAQEIWGGPGATYVPRQDSKQITQNCNRQKQNF